MTLRDRESFACTDSERAAFEAGIKLGSLFHQYLGLPLNEKNVEAMERAIEGGMRTQPYVVEASVNIDRELIHRHRSEFGYCALNERMMEAEVVVRYNGVEIRASLSWVEELRYPLMRIVDVKRKQGG